MYVCMRYFDVYTYLHAYNVFTFLDKHISVCTSQ